MGFPKKTQKSFAKFDESLWSANMPSRSETKKMLSLLVVISHFGLSRGFNSSPQELTEKIMQKGTNATNGA